MKRVSGKATKLIARSSNSNERRRERSGDVIGPRGHIISSELQGPWPKIGPTVYHLRVINGKGKVRRSRMPLGAWLRD